MAIADILTPSRTLCGAPGTSKKSALVNTAEFICQDITAIDSSTLFKQLISRERLGSTAIGYGVAIPHCRLEGCAAITGALVKLAETIDFDSFDNEPVDILFVLLVPEQACDEHLQVLKRLAQLFSQSEIRKAMREATDSEELYQVVVDYEQAELCIDSPAPDHGPVKCS